MKALFFFALVVLTITFPDNHGALWFALMTGTIIGLLRYNLKSK